MVDVMIIADFNSGKQDITHWNWIPYAFLSDLEDDQNCVFYKVFENGELTGSWSR